MGFKRAMSVTLRSRDSNTLSELLLGMAAGQRVVVQEDTWSSWITVDVYGVLGFQNMFGIWKATDKLYVADSMGAMGDDPISVEEALKLITHDD
jgi:hypothetical protein